MPSQSRLVAPALVPALVATLAVALPGPRASAATDCLAAPSEEAPEGSRWFYRTDRATQRKCWYLTQNGRKVATAPRVRARAAVARAAVTTATVGDGQTAAPAAAASAPGSADALTRRECDIELDVLNYRKMLAGIFPTEAQGGGVDPQAGELAAKQCQKPGS